MKPPFSPFAGAIGALVAACVLGACGASGPSFHADFAPQYRAGGTVAVLGVLKDGRLDPELWKELGPALLPIGPCPAGYSPELVAANPELASAVDDYVRANGVTDALLAQLGKLAKSDTIVLFSVSGHPPRQTGPTVYTLKPQTLAMTKPASPYNAHTPTDGSVFQVTASLYSVPERRPSAQLDMTSASSDVDGAIAEFGRRMKTQLPMAGCTGWNPDPHAIEESAIRELKD